MQERQHSNKKNQHEKTLMPIHLFGEKMSQDRPLAEYIIKGGIPRPHLKRSLIECCKKVLNVISNNTNASIQLTTHTSTLSFNNQSPGGLQWMCKQPTWVLKLV